jgi:hypothetical protein
MTGRQPSVQWVAAELHIKCGYLARDGSTEEPTAYYRCHRCSSTEGPVSGVRAVQAFVEHVKPVHARRCAAIAAQPT